MGAYIENTGFEDFEEEIFSAFHYYSLTKNLNNTYRYVIELQDPIDGGILSDILSLKFFPYKAIKRFLFTLAVTQQYETNTFLVSYIGKADFSGCTKYVKSMRCDLDTPRIGIVMEICAINDKFYVDMIMDFSNPKYLDAFCDELTKQRIHHWCGKITPLKTPKCRY